MGKQADTNSDKDWGGVKILLFPPPGPRNAARQTPAAQLFLRFRFQEAGPNLDGAHSKAFVCGVMRHAAIFLRPETEGQVQIESAAMERS